MQLNRLMKSLPPLIVAVTGLIIALDQAGIIDRMFPLESDEAAVAAFETVRTAPEPIELFEISAMPHPGFDLVPMPTFEPLPMVRIVGEAIVFAAE